MPLPSLAEIFTKYIFTDQHPRFRSIQGNQQQIEHTNSSVHNPIEFLFWFPLHLLCTLKHAAIWKPTHNTTLL